MLGSRLILHSLHLRKPFSTSSTLSKASRTVYKTVSIAQLRRPSYANYPQLAAISLPRKYPRRLTANKYTRTICHLHSSHSTMSDPATGVVSGQSTLAPQQKPDVYRLPTTVSPTHYELVIKTDLSTSPPTFSGEVLITLDVHSNISTLVFNIHPTLEITHISIASTDLKTSSSVSLPTSALTVSEEQERGTVDLSSLPGGGLKQSKGVKAWFRFEAELGGSMLGYYKSEGDADEQGKKQVYALTQFESTAARRAFPSWDEPLLKATYGITLIAREKETVLSNMPEVSSKLWKPSHVSSDSVSLDGYELGSMLAVGSEGKTEQSGGWKITKFETTPPMSTYLVAFACGEFAHLSSEHVSKKTGQTIPLRIYAVESQIKQAQFGLDIKKWALPIYEEIFDIPYALPKLDTLVAHDFDGDAMENWGLITGRTTAYLVDKEKSPFSAVKRIAQVQCHELAHMWFGDIVTMKWWDNLWLNEAFATFMGELIIPDRIWPDWKVRLAFLNNHWVRALALDSQRSSHPIEVECPDANQINQIFDAISYSKGASVLRMLSAIVSEEKFLKGVSIYLKKHLYSNAETKDLWAGIAEVSGLDVAGLMANWTMKIGFPMITVEEIGNGKIKVTQNRFLSTGDVKPDEDETLWWVPLEIKTLQSGKIAIDHNAVLQDRSMTYDVRGAESFKINADSVGVYRVNYSPERLVKLGKDASSFSVADRVGLISDATTLARAGYSKTSGSLSLIKGLGGEETEFLPWSQIAQALDKLADVWWEQPEAIRNALDKLRRSLFRPIVDRMGYDHKSDDAPEVKELRTLVVSTCAAAGDKAVLAELNRRFELFQASGDDSQIPPDLQRSAFVNAVRHGGAKEYEKILSVYNKPPTPSSKVDAMWALCSTRDEKLLDRTFEMMGNGSVKDQDIYIFYFGLSANRLSRRRLGDLFKKEYADLFKRFSDVMGMTYLVKGAFASLTNYEDLDMVKNFFKDKDVRKFRLGVSQVYDSIQASADWLKRDQKDVEDWLREDNYV